nr:12827_t:CDS:2 [Entrophospora candida]
MANFVGEIKDIKDKKQLVNELRKFMVGVKRRDGKNYAPRSLYVGVCAVIRGLQQEIPTLAENLHDRNKNFILWNTISGRIKQVQDTDNRKRKKSDALDTEEIIQILGHPSMNLDDPTSLTKKVAFCLTITLPREKNHAGGLQDMDNSSRVCEIPPDNDNLFRPVHDVMYYMKRRPTNTECEFFFLRIESKINLENSKWFRKEKLGKHTHQKLLKDICNDCGINIGKKHIVNHSLRTTGIMQLSKLGTPTEQIMAFSGHRSLAGLSSYQDITKKQKINNVSSLIPSSIIKPHMDFKEKFGEPLKEINNHPSIRKTLGSKISEKINNDVLKKPFKLPTKKKSGSDELFIEENLNNDDSMPNIIIKGDNNSINVNINYNNAL